MLWLTNTYDPKRDDAKYHLPVSIDKNRDEEWADKLEWIGGLIVGVPRATDFHSVDELVEMGYVGGVQGY